MIQSASQSRQLNAKRGLLYSVLETDKRQMQSS